MLNLLSFRSLLILIACAAIPLCAIQAEAQVIELSASFVLPEEGPEPPEPPEGEPAPPEPPEAPHQFVIESRFRAAADGSEARLLFEMIAVRHRQLEDTGLRDPDIPDSIMRCYIRRNGTLIARYDVAFGLMIRDGIDPETGEAIPLEFELTPNGSAARLKIWEGQRRTSEGELILDEGIVSERIDDELFLNPGIANIQAGDQLVVSIIKDGESVKRYRATYE